MTRFALLIAPLALATSLAVVPGEAREPAPAAPTLRFERDITFGKNEQAVLTLNLARPADDGVARPCVVVIHGGGWSAGRKEQHDDLIKVLAQDGFVAATISYGLCPQCPWPAQIHDVKAAVRFLRSKATAYGIDPTRMAALGFSAGAHLAMLLGTLDPQDGLEGPEAKDYPSSKVQAVIAFFGPTDMEQLVDTGKTELQRKLKRQALSHLLGPRFAEDVGGMSPIRYVDGNDAPMLIFQGTRDRLVPTRRRRPCSTACTRRRSAPRSRFSSEPATAGEIRCWPRRSTRRSTSSTACSGPSASSGSPIVCARRAEWCPGGDSNSHSRYRN